MRKIEHIYENPLDNILIEISDFLSPYAYRLGLTPNILTTISILFAGITVYLLFNKYYMLASFMYLVSYYFDCMDGFFARKYKMYSKFGDYYDHIADITKVTFIFFTLYYINSKKFFTFLPLIIIFGILFNIHIGCQELYYDKNESDVLNIFKKICPVRNKNDKNEILNAMTYTRYVGCGTFNLLIIILIIYYGI